MEESIDLNELLQHLQKKEEKSNDVSSEQSNPVETILRPIQFICNDIIKSYGNTNVEQGNVDLNNYKKELVTRTKKKPIGLSNFPSSTHSDLKKLYEIQMKRLTLSNILAKECTDAVSKVKKSVERVRKETLKSFDQYKTNIENACEVWNQKADDISKLNNRTVKGNHMQIENDWNRLVENNDKIQVLSGGGSALRRLDLATTLGSTPSESIVGRAKQFDEKKSLHENIHWRLRNSVDSVSANLLQKRREENERNVLNSTSDAIIRAKAAVRDSITHYTVEDASLKYEVDMLQQALSGKNVSTDSVLHNIMLEVEWNEYKNRQTLSALL